VTYFAKPEAVKVGTPCSVPPRARPQPASLGQRPPKRPLRLRPDVGAPVCPGDSSNEAAYAEPRVLPDALGIVVHDVRVEASPCYGQRRLHAPIVMACRQMEIGADDSALRGGDRLDAQSGDGGGEWERDRSLYRRLGCAMNEIELSPRWRRRPPDLLFAPREPRGPSKGRRECP
jgi:hypothetical protein